MLEGDFGQIAEDALGELQDRDQGARLIFVARDHVVEAGEQFLLAGLLATALLQDFGHPTLLCSCRKSTVSFTV